MQAQNANRMRWFGSWWIIIDGIIQVNVREGHRAIGNRQSSRPLLRADRQVDIRLPHQQWMRQRLSSGRTLGFTGRGQDHFGILVTAQSESEITKKKCPNYCCSSKSGVTEWRQSKGPSCTGKGPTSALYWHAFIRNTWCLRSRGQSFLQSESTFQESRRKDLNFHTF